MPLHHRFILWGFYVHITSQHKSFDRPAMVLNRQPLYGQKMQEQANYYVFGSGSKRSTDHWWIDMLGTRIQQQPLGIETSNCFLGGV
jgi:hypothetical protein